MQVKVIKQFPMSFDRGTQTRLAEEGEIIDIDEAMFDGLKDEGFIKTATKKEIADWDNKMEPNPAEENKDEDDGDEIPNPLGGDDPDEDYEDEDEDEDED